MIKKRVWWASLATLILFAASLFFDRQIIQFIVSLRDNFLNHLFLSVKFLDTEIFIVLFLTLILLWRKNKREWVIPLWLTVLVTGIAAFVLKYSIQRPRPFVQNIVTLLPGLIDKASYHTFDFSFPSFDTALVFCAAPLIWRFFPKFRYFWVSFSVLVGLSRIYFGVHFLSDVVFGAAMGILIGVAIINFEEKRGSLRKIYSKIMGSLKNK